VSDCTGCQNLSNPTYQGTREMCRIVQDVRTCLIRHTTMRTGFNFGVCVFINHPQLTIIFLTLGRYECHPRLSTEISLILKKLMFYYSQNLSNPTYQGTREMCRIVQDVRTCLIRHTKGPGKCVGLYRMSSCTIRHISLVPWYVGLDRF
jgi:hypothetical protein